MRDNPNFKPWRDARKVFKVWPTFLYRVLRGQDRPSPERAKAWQAITGISFQDFLFYNGKNRKPK